MGNSWTCPYCNRPCTVGAEDVRTMSASKWIAKRYGNYMSDTTVIVCPNPECGQQTIGLTI